MADNLAAMGQRRKLIWFVLAVLGVNKKEDSVQTEITKTKITAGISNVGIAGTSNVNEREEVAIHVNERKEITIHVNERNETFQTEITQTETVVGTSNVGTAGTSNVNEREETTIQVNEREQTVQIEITETEIAAGTTGTSNVGATGTSNINEMRRQLFSSIGAQLIYKNRLDIAY
ncbi:hypothetical protein Pfo_021441, partial [Paulownia fortunei]